MSKPLASKQAPSQDNIMGFVHRYNDLMVVRDSTDKLIEVRKTTKAGRKTRQEITAIDSFPAQDILLYCQGLERALHQETDRLTGELRNCQLDLADATAATHQLQQKLSHTEAEMTSLYKENDTYKVGSKLAHGTATRYLDTAAGIDL